MSESKIVFTERPGIKRKGPKLDPEKLAEFIRTFRFKLPADYQQFLLSLNGVNFSEATPGEEYAFPVRRRWLDQHRRSPKIYPKFEWPPVADVFRDVIELPIELLGLGGDSSISPQNPYYGFGNVMPPGWLVIGFTDLNDIICLSCSDVNYGAVYCWNTISGADGNPNDAIDGLSFAAESFGQFWQDLVPVAVDNLIR